jgi:hypothetical protein
LTEEARLSTVQARVDTARRVIGYLSAAIGLVALFFGLGGLLSTLLRLVLAPDVLGAGWRAALSLSLALSVVALPAYGIAARAMEQLARTSLVEERTLARRVSLYAALLFGLVAAISAAVTVLRLTLGALLGAAEPALAAEIGSWLSYTLVGAAIAGFYAMRLRWTTGVPAHAGAGLTIAIVAGAAFTPRLVAALERELPGARLQVADLQEPAQAGAALVGADILVAALAAAFDSPAAAAIRTFSGRRLLLATDVPGYELVSTRGDDALAREAAHLLRMQVQSAPAATVTIAQPSVANP